MGRSSRSFCEYGGVETTLDCCVFHASYFRSDLFCFLEYQKITFLVPYVLNPLFWLLYQNKDVTEAIQKVAAAYDCKIVEGVLSHQLKQFVIDGNKVVLSVSSPDVRVDDAEFEENEVYSIDIAASTGEGKVMVGILWCTSVDCE